MTPSFCLKFHSYFIWLYLEQPFCFLKSIIDESSWMTSLRVYCRPATLLGPKLLCIVIQIYRQYRYLQLVLVLEIQVLIFILILTIQVLVLPFRDTVTRHNPIHLFLRGCQLSTCLSSHFLSSRSISFVLSYGIYYWLFSELGDSINRRQLVQWRNFWSLAN